MNENLVKPYGRLVMSIEPMNMLPSKLYMTFMKANGQHSSIRLNK